jgi:aminopeptidase N
MAGEVSIAAYVEQAMALAFEEEDARVIEQSLASVIAAIDTLHRLSPDFDDAMVRLVPWIEVESLRRAEFAEAADLKLTWFNTYLGVAASPAGLGTARALLSGEAEVAGIDISPDVRWTLLTILSRNGVGGTDDLLAAERERDPSDSGAKRLLTARASMPDIAVKATMLADVQDPQSTSGLAQHRAVMAGLFPPNQTALQLELLDDVLDALPSLSKRSDPYFLSSYVGTLLAPICRPESSARMQAALENPAIQQNSTVRRFLQEALQADGECRSLRGALR